MAGLTRTSVNLLLIVAITIQQAVVCAGQAGCSAVGTSHFTCQGCGCCAVETPNDRCPCCSGDSEASSDTEGASYCGHDGLEKQHKTTSPADNAQAGSEIAEPSCFADEILESSSGKSAVDSSCSCFRRPETPYAPVPRSPDNEVSDIVSLGFTFTGIAIEPKEPLASVSDFDNAPATAMSHFAQIEFCVWRL